MRALLLGMLWMALMLFVAYDRGNSIPDLLRMSLLFDAHLNQWLRGRA